MEKRCFYEYSIDRKEMLKQVQHDVYTGRDAETTLKLP
jgi:hypothetical protein